MRENDPTWMRAFGHLPPKKRTEELLHSQVCKYLKLQYPKVRFHTSLDGERHTGSNQGLKIRSRQWGSGFPDLLIYESRGRCPGLALEFKRETPYRKDRQLKAGQHLLDQLGWLNYLRNNWWHAEFCWDFDKAKLMIDEHLNS